MSSSVNIFRETFWKKFAQFSDQSNREQIPMQENVS